MATVTPQTLDQTVELEENDLIMTTNSEGITKTIPGATIKEFYAEASAADAPAAASVKEIYLKNSDTSKPWLNNYAKTSLPRSFIINITFNKGNTYGDASATYPQIKIYNKDNVLLGTYSVCDSRGHYAGAKCYNDGDTMTFKAIGNKLMIQNSDVRTATSDYTQYADGRIEYVISSNLGNLTIDSFLDFIKQNPTGFRAGIFYNISGWWTEFEGYIYKASDTRYIGSFTLCVSNSTQITRYRIDGTTWVSQIITN